MSKKDNKKTEKETKTGEEGKGPAKGKKQLPIEEVMMTIDDFISYNESDKRRGTPIGAAFKAWWTITKGKSLGVRQKMADWIKVYQECLKQPVKN